jgi:hypothetical protein
MPRTTEVTGQEDWRTVHRIADAGVPRLTKAIKDAWNYQQSKIDARALGDYLSRSGTTNIDWTAETVGLHGALVTVGGDIAREVATALLPSLEAQVKATEAYTDWLDLAFDLRFMAAEEFLQKYLPSLIVGITTQTQAAVRDIVLEGFRIGRHPYEMADNIKAIVGMTPAQLRAYRAFAANLMRSKLTAVRQEEALAAYRDRAIELRAKNIARTETIRAANAGQRALWEDAVDNGLMGSGVMRKWIGTPDSRACEYCKDLWNEEVGLDEPWVKGKFVVMQPPFHPSCRCAMGLVFA